jgi:hypothetical protein
MNLGHWWDLMLMAGLVGSTVLLLGPRIITASLPAMVAALGALPGAVVASAGDCRGFDATNLAAFVLAHAAGRPRAMH